MTMKLPGARTRVIALLGGVALAIGVGTAKADIISFDLGVGNAAISGFPGPYASVEVNQTSTTTAIITFDSLSNGGNTYLMGDGGSVGLNINGTFTDTFSGTVLPGFSGPQLTSGGAGNEDGFGTFNLTVNEFDGAGFALSEVVVNVTATGATTWASALDVLINNSLGNAAAAHIFVFASPADPANGALATGFAGASNGGGGGNFIPEPTSLALLGVALLGVGAMVRRRS